MAESSIPEDVDNVAIIALASTGLFKGNFDPEVCQITLMKPNGTKLFSKYVLPERSFQKGMYINVYMCTELKFGVQRMFTLLFTDASRFNGFTIEEVDGKRHLMRNGEVVKTYPLQKILKEFQNTISSFRAQVSGRIVLVGYYCHAFDIRLLMQEMKRCQFSGEIFSENNVVFADLYELVRFKRYDLFRFCKDLKMTTVYNAVCKAQELHNHDAIEDAKKLGAIYTHIKGLVDKQTFQRFIFSVNEQGINDLGVSTPPQRTCVKRDAESDTADHDLPFGPARKKPMLEET